MSNETRTQTICRHVTAYLQATGASKPTFGQCVAEEYRRRVPAILREIAFSDAADSFQQMKNNGQTLFRFFDGYPRLPADLEESVMFALPEPRMQALRADLAARMGLLHVAKVSGETLAARTACAGMLAKESGEALRALGELMASDVAGPQHEVALGEALKELDDLIATAQGVRAAMEEHRAVASAQTMRLKRVG